MVGLDWALLEFVGLSFAELAWARLVWSELSREGWASLDCRLYCVQLDFYMLGWNRLRWSWLDVAASLGSRLCWAEFGTALSRLG